MMRLIFLFFGLLSFIPLQGNAQLKLHYEQHSLLSVLHDLHERYGLQYSFASHEAQADCELSLSGEFSTLENALANLLSNCAYQYQLIGGVYIISDKPLKSKTNTLSIIEGRLIDAKTRKPLSNVVIRHANGSSLSDAEGYFRIEQAVKTKPVFFSHLAYQNIDTLLSANEDHTLPLTPREMELATVWIQDWLSNDTSYLELEIVKALQGQKLQAGIYRSIDEMLQNKPSIAWKEGKKRRDSYRTWFNYVPNTYRLRMPEEDRRGIRTVWGFSDGEDLYVNIRYNQRFNYYAQFAKLHLVGPYLYYEYFDETNRFLEDRALGWEHWVLDLEKMESFQLDKYYIEEKIAVNEALNKAYENEMAKRFVIGRFLFRYYDTPYPYE
ncbi:MAG: hypothetical protein AAF927_05275 [Bacteroidota bacterium]